MIDIFWTLLGYVGRLFLAVWLTVWVGAVVIAFLTQGLKAWRYILLTIPFWVVFFARYPASVVAVLFFSTPDKLYLKRWKWLETIDNTLAGDHGHQTEHMLGCDPLAWYNRVLWLWRNGGNRFNYEVIGVPDEDQPDWAWWYQKNIPFAPGRFIDIRLGWAIHAPNPDWCKYVLTIRPKTKP